MSTHSDPYVFAIRQTHFLLCEDPSPPLDDPFYVGVYVWRPENIPTMCQTAQVLHRGQLLSDETVGPILSSLLSALYVNIDDELVPKVSHACRRLRSIPTRRDSHGLHVPGIDILIRFVATEAVDLATEGILNLGLNTVNSLPATEASIESLEKVVVDDGGGSVDPCAVCLEELCGGLELTRMPCRHIYHGVCIAQWLNKSHMCPLCRYKMPT